MEVGLIDVDGHNYPNLALMKISAWHKKNGDSVKWYEPLFDAYPKKPLDRVYMSKVFTFTPDYTYPVNAEEIIKGGTGYFYLDGGGTVTGRNRTRLPGLFAIRDKRYSLRLFDAWLPARL